MRTVKNAVICAAGMGTRLGLNVPKCLVKIRGKCVIDYILELLTEVKNVRIVVGFMEEEVIEHVVRIRKDVVFVRNPDFRNTSNSYSLSLGATGIKGPFLSIDGDMLIESESFMRFLKTFDGENTLIGISKSKTEEAVFVERNEGGDVVKFQRTPSLKYEWCGVAIISPPVKISSDLKGGYVFEHFEKFIPLASSEIECYEIDTPNDLDYATANFKGGSNY